MGPRGFDRRQLLAAVGFVAAVVVLAVQLITPSPVMVSLGRNGAETTQVGQYFTYADVWVIAASAVVCGASGATLLFDGLTASSDGSADDERPTTSRSTSSTRTDTTETITDGAPGATDSVDPSDQQVAEWEEVADRLRDNKATIYTLLIEADGTLPQRDLVDDTDLSKATVSRTLDSLEQRNLVERKRRGMGNVVHLT